MPRTKSQPVQRSAHRFDSPGEGDELTSVSDFTNVLSVEATDVDRPPAKKKRSSVASSEENAQPRDFDRIDIDRELILALGDTYSLVRRECLGTVDDSVQDIALYAFKSCITVAFDKLLTTSEEDVSTSTVRNIKSAVKGGSICIALIVSSDDDLFVEKYLAKEASNIHPSVISWLIRPSEAALTWSTAHGPSTFHFDAHSMQTWLQNASNTLLIPNDELHEIASELKSLGVVSSLRKYQLEGVAWMYNQLTASQDLVLPTIGWLSIANEGSINSDLLYHEVLRSVQPRVIVDSLQYSSSVPCCILADEMGVGKSLQVLALVLLMKHRLIEDLDVGADPEVMIAFITSLESNRSQATKKRKILTFASDDLTLPCFCGNNELTQADIGWVQCSSCLRWRHVRCAGFDSMNAANKRTSYVCYPCSAMYYYHHPIQSAATLIIMPNTLIHQWVNEVKKHIYTPGNSQRTPLKIAVYKNAKKPHQFARSTVEYIASFDIVLMSFRTLKACFHESEIDYDNLHQRSSRKYDIAPPSILGVNFRMIVIDETQNLEGSTQSQVLKMACKLRSRAKISVSGTPFGAGTVSDALYLAQFLDLCPSITQTATVNQWIDFFTTPKLPITNELRLTWLRSIFSPRFLRRTKDIIRDQLGIGEKYTLVRTLKFSRFEMKLYEDQAHAAETELLSLKANVKLQELGRSKLELMRKGCCHPQIFDKTLKNKSNIASGAMPLDHVMIVKVEQSKQKCEETQRDLLFYLFKMAGLKLLKAMDSKDTSQSITQCMVAAKIYAFAWQTMIKNRSPCAAMALIQLHGDTSLTQTQVVLPCISSIALMWSRRNSEDDHERGSSHQQQQSMVAIVQNMSETCTWFDSLPALLAQSSSVAAFSSNSSSSKKKKQFVTGLNWHPFARLCFAHSKSLASATFATSAENILKLAEPQQSAASSKAMQLIVFPYEVSLSASDSHDAFLPVMTRKAQTPFHPDDATEDAAQERAMIAVDEQRLLHRCKQWKVDVLNFTSDAILLRHDPPTSTVHYAKVSVESWWELVEQGALEVHIAGELSLVETAFDADHLQELHVLHNLSYALRSLTSSTEATSEASKALLEQHIQAPVTLAQLPHEDDVLARKIEEYMLHEQQANSDSSVIVTTPSSAMIGGTSAAATADSAVFLPELVDSSDSMHNYQQRLFNRKELIQRDFVDHASDRRTLAVAKLKEQIAKVAAIESEILSMAHDRAWWIELLNELKFNTNFLLDVQETVDKGEAAYSKFRSFRDINGLLFLLGQEFDGLQKARIKAVKALQHISTQPSDEEVRKSTNCQKCRAYFNKTGPICSHCRIFTTALEPYRKDYLVAARRRTTQIVSTGDKKRAIGGMDDLFDIGVDTREFDQDMTDGAYAMFLRLMRKYAPKGEFSELCKMEIKWIDALVAENTAMVAAWDRYSELLKSYDEIAQCTTRVQLAANMQEKLDKDGPERFFPAELDAQFQDSMFLAATAEHDLKSAISSLNFFKGQVQQCQAEDDRREENCGICKETMSATTDNDDSADELVVLPCAHRFHKECAMQWVIAHKKCPLCRTPTPQHLLTIVTPSTHKQPSQGHSNSHYASADGSLLTKIDAQGNQQPIIDRQFITYKKKVIGRWGTKIDALLTDLLILHADESKESEKMIIFSQWLEMLEIVSDALRVNKLPFTKCFSRTKDFDSAVTGIELFRSDPKVRILLLPLALGAEGLDLIIASHVFLLEPLLNRSQELQAINRIDRIGQERMTFVHKYLITETIEERIEEYQREKGTVGAAASNKKKKRHTAGDDEQLNLTDMQFILNLEGKLGTGEDDEEAEEEVEYMDEINEEDEVMDDL